jgi:hypothetical protein
MGEQSPRFVARTLPMPSTIMPAEPGPSLRTCSVRVAATAVASTCGELTSPTATVTLEARSRLGRVPQ